MLSEFLDCQPLLSGKTLTLRPLDLNDLEGLFRAASDPEIWAGHPAKDRYKREVFEPFFASLIVTKRAVAIVDTASTEIVGTSSYYTPPDLPNSVAIGLTFLVRAKWGGDTNRELKRLMLEHAFQTVDIVYFHIAPTNIRSQKATMKLGAVCLYDVTLDLSGTPLEWKCYGLTKTQWRQSLAK